MHRSWTTSGPDLQLALDPRGARGDAIEQALRSAIRDGRLAAGQRLPSTRVLASDLGLARGTVVEAYAQLAAEGYLDARRGSGTWVGNVALAAPDIATRAPQTSHTLRYSFHPGLPDLTAFPHAAWSSAARRGLRHASTASLGYGDPRGRPELREALAAYLARARGAVADPELVVVCAGFRHGLSLLLRVLAARGRGSVAMEDPCLDLHREVAAAAGLRVVPLPVDEHGAQTSLLRESGAVAAVLAPAHQYPLGAVLHPERRAAAVAWARATGGLLIEDDYDAELRFDRPPVGVLQSLDAEHVAYGGTASKTLAPGLRLAWLLVPPTLLGPILALRDVEDLHVPATEQIAFSELLRSGAFERHVRRMRSRYRARRDRVAEMLSTRAPSVRMIGISAGLRVLLLLPRDGISAEELAALAAARSIELFPVGPYHHDGRPESHGVLVGYGALPEHAFEAGVDALGDVLAESIR